MEKRMLVAKVTMTLSEGQGVETIDYFDDRINNIALVTMEDDIADVSRCQDKASRRKLDGHQVDLVEVGAPVGMVVKELPQHVAEEELRSYFESSESGGRHGVTEQCKIYSACHTATVLIGDSEVLQSILKKEDHDIVGNGLPATVMPFYQEFHNDVLELLEDLQEQGEITHD